MRANQYTLLDKASLQIRSLLRYLDQIASRNTRADTSLWSCTRILLTVTQYTSLIALSAKNERTEEVCKVIAMYVSSCRRVCQIHVSRPVTRAVLSNTGTCPINFQRDGTRRFCGNVYYSVSGDRLHSTLTHHTRDLLVTMERGISRNPQCVSDPAFPDQKALSACNFSVSDDGASLRISERCFDDSGKCAAPPLPVFSDLIYLKDARPRGLSHERW